uniref:Protein tyrosine kinase n=1 Tax=Monosiga ovata TaxID=81526 RepID=B3XVW9_9EUKA|nr:protein tyrosine kinase [Monosiga ovata]
MGCGESKARRDGPSADPLRGTGVGALARGLDDHYKKNPKQSIAVLTGPFEIARDRLDASHHVLMGEGPFGLVYEGRASIGDGGKNIPVVVKKLKNDVEAAVRSDFIKEIQYMREFQNANVLKLLGAVTTDVPMLAIFESPTHGTLRSYLEQSRLNNSISAVEQIQLAYEVWQGFAYIEERGIVHRDLATRNCLVFDDHVVKIGDFGLYRTRYATDYLPLDPNGPALPLRWMAPESLADPSIWTTKTDVWSFGVLLWEIWTLANQPYPALANSEIVSFVCDGGRLEPTGRTEGLNEVVRMCTAREPSARPPIEEIGEMLSSELVAAPVNVRVSVPSTAQASHTPSVHTSRTASVINMTPPRAGPDGDQLQPLAPIPMSPGGPDAEDKRHSTFSTVPMNDNPTYIQPGDALLSELGVPSPEDRRNFRALTAFKEAENPGREFSKMTAAREIECDDVDILNELGKGAFGVVMRGDVVIDGEKFACAIKMLRAGASEEDKDSLLAEATLMSTFNHPNVLCCYGQVSLTTPVMVLLEFMELGSVFSWLKSLTVVPDLRTKIRMAIDIASGLAYLESKNFVHRDVAARNILINEERRCKISDFGLSRDLEDEMYYESDGGMVPVRWTPPESFKYRKYSSASDVWSFGITLYEIWTKAALPYGSAWSNLNVMMEVERGYRLPPPSDCPRAVYAMMMECWHPQPRHRPTFGQLLNKLTMARDMLFAADGTVMVVDAPGSELATLYVGMQVPSADEVDAYVQPADLRSPANASPVGLRFSESPLSMEIPMITCPPSLTPSSLTPAPSMASSTSEKGNTERRYSLRKQREVSQVVSEAGPTVEYDKVKKVSEVIQLAKHKETVSYLEVTGFKKAEQTGVQVNINPTYIESVGRAREAEAKSNIAGRGKCVCRRFKCVCNL